MKRNLAVPFLAVLSVVPCAAQLNTGAVLGRVLDSSGAIVADADVSITRQETRFTRSSKSDSLGNYQFVLLPPGTYDVAVQHSGFKEEVQAGVVVAAGDQIHLDLTLSPGVVTERVSVTANAPVTDTESSSLGFLVDTHQVESLPLNSRDFSLLVRLGAGVVPSLPSTVASFSFNGASQYGVNLSLDGTDASFIETPTLGDPSGQSLLDTVSPDTIEQLEVRTGTFSAEVGRATGGFVNIITKSGTNTFHGSLWEYFRNSDLDARNFFVSAKAPLHQNQYGGTVGGPVIKDHLFFFGSYEGSRARIGQQITSNVPTQSFRDASPTAYAKYFAVLPLPTQAIAGNTNAGFYRRTDDLRADENVYNARGDYIAGRSALAVRFSLKNGTNDSPQLIPADRLVYPITNYLSTVSYTTTLSPASLNEVRLGWDRWDVPRQSLTFPQTLGQITITGLLTGGNFEGLLHFVDSTYTLADTFIHRTTHHSLHVGFEIRRLDSFRVQRQTPIWTYTSAAQFLANTPDTLRVIFGNLGTGLRQYQQGYFIQDDWHLKPRLTLNLGLRYDYFSPLSGPMINTGADPFGPFNPRGAPLFKPDRNNFQPRVGFAWDINGNQRTVLRGGFGVYTVALPPYFIWNTATIDGRLPFSATYNSPDLPPSLMAYPLSGVLLSSFLNPYNAVANGLAPSIVSRTVISPNLPNPYTLTANLTVERQLSQNLLLQTSFVGTRNLKTPGARVLNLIDPVTHQRLNPAIGEIDLTDSSGRRNYNALQVSLRKRFSGGLVANANYTWSHAIVYGGDEGFNGQAVQDWSNMAGSRGDSKLDLRHMLVLDASWAVPSSHFSTNALTRSLLGGWVVSSVTQLRSGLAINLLTGRDIRGDGFASTQRPNYLGGSLYASNQSITQWFNTAAFANPAAGTFGNLGYNVARGPIRVEIDMALAKRFTIWRENQLQFRIDMFNVPNRANFGNPDPTINSPTFGQITSADIPRQIQLSLRYKF